MKENACFIFFLVNILFHYSVNVQEAAEKKNDGGLASFLIISRFLIPVKHFYIPSPFFSVRFLFDSMNLFREDFKLFNSA